MEERTVVGSNKSLYSLEGMARIVEFATCETSQLAEGGERVQ
jgi:hypothetical protein